MLMYIFVKSPKAYKLIRKMLNLPSADTLVRFLRLSSVNLGFGHQLFQNIKNAVENLQEMDR